jgi:hypothetical protein
MILSRAGEIFRLPSYILYEIMVLEENVVSRKIILKFNITQNNGK